MFLKNVSARPAGARRAPCVRIAFAFSSTILFSSECSVLLLEMLIVYGLQS